MTIKIPVKDIAKQYDDVVILARQFAIDVDNVDDIIILNADKDELHEFLIALNDVNLSAADKMLIKYATNNNIKQYTPESALQAIDEFVKSKGGFDGYDAAYLALSNCIVGIE